MKSPRKLALFDMDGTLADYHTKLKTDMENIAAPNEDVNYDYHGIMPNHIFKRKNLITSQPGWWLGLDCLQLGWDIYHMCVIIGYEIMILTKGPIDRHNSWAEKLQWCKKYVQDNNITVTTDKSIMYGRVLVDDYPDYMLSWLKYRPRGVGIMPKSEMSKGFSHPQVIIYDGTNKDEVKNVLIKSFERE
jgi:5'(3')-deoxyribonucleotidase